MKPENFTIPSIKAFLKDLALMIRICKQLRKLEKNQHLDHFKVEDVAAAAKKVTSLYSLRFQARHYHIAYCEFRGRTRQQIEAKVNHATAKFNTDEKLIISLKESMVAANQALLPVTPEVPVSA